MMIMIQKRREMNSDDGVWMSFVILCDGKTVGSASVIEYESDETALLERIDVEDAYQNRGIGTQAIKLIKEQRIEKTGTLFCAADNPDAARLYERIGRRATADSWMYLDEGYGVFEL